MSRSDGAALLAVTAAIALIDALWLVCGGNAGVASDDRFARATCGLGVGATIAPDWGLFAVDARLQSSCEGELQPMPGLACPDPNHGAGVATLPARP